MKISNLEKVLEHPISKRITVASLISIGTGLLRAWLGEHSILIGVLVGVGAYIFADWLFSTKSERQARIQQAATFFREHRMRIGNLEKVLEHPVLVMYVLMCAYFFSSLSEPVEPVVKQVLSLVQTFGIVAVFIEPTITGTLTTAVWGSWSSATSLASRFLSGLAFYSMALWLIGQKGDALYKWILTNQNDAAVGAATLAIVWMILRLSDTTPNRPESIARSSGAAIAGRIIAPKPTARDNRYTAAHEAGHALVYAALGRLPSDMKLTINDIPDHNGVLGFVTGIKSEHRLDEKTFAEWYMLVFLAGKMGEARIMGDSTLGSINDHTRWLNVARQYLSNHYRGIFYPEPQNELELKQNEVKLDSLQVEQLALLICLFDMNTEVFRALADELLEKRSLSCDDLIPFLSKVEIPEAFPLPFGSFEKFSTEKHDAGDSKKSEA